MDKAFHTIADGIDSIRWRDFPDEPYYDWYYAEDRLYVIRDRVYQTLWFTEARSPKEAFKKFRSMCQDIASAGVFDDD